MLAINRSLQFQKATEVLSGGGESIYWFETETDA
jgi:hypothetical protein